MIHNSKAAPDSKNLKTTCKDRMPKAKNSGNIGIRKMRYREFEGFILGIFGIPKEKQRKKLVKKLKSANIDKNFKIKILVPKSSTCFPKRKKQKLNYDIDIEDKVLEIFHSLKDKGSITKIQKRLKIDYSTKLDRAIIRKILNKNGLKMNIYKKKARQKITDLSVQNHSFAKNHYRNEEGENSARMHIKYAKSFSDDVSESDVNFSLDYHYNGKSKKAEFLTEFFAL